MAVRKRNEKIRGWRVREIVGNTETQTTSELALKPAFRTASVVGNEICPDFLANSVGNSMTLLILSFS